MIPGGAESFTAIEEAIEAGRSRRQGRANLASPLHQNVWRSSHESKGVESLPNGRFA